MKTISFFFIVLLIIISLSNCDTKSVEYSHYVNGQIASEINKINGKIEGICKMYYPDGTLAMEANIHNGEGLGKSYYEDGTLASEGKYIVTQSTRETIIPYEEHRYYYKNGKLNAILNHTKSSFGGVAKYFYNNGILYMEGSFNRGLFDGIWKTYTMTGELAEEAIYKDDSLMSQKIFYYCTLLNLGFRAFLIRLSFIAIFGANWLVR